MNTDQPRRNGIAMSEQLKPCPFCGSCNIGSSYIVTYSVDSSYDVFGCKDCEARFENGNADEWNTRTEDAALAAKDARIAELEAHCKRLGAGDAERYWEGRWRDTAAELSRLRDAATPFEDGGEVPEVVAWLDERGAHVPPHCVSFQDDRKKFERAMASNGAEPLMTVAQHSRIVAAKDAEIALLRGPEQTVTSPRGDKLFTFMSKDPCRYRLCEVTYANPVRRLIAERDGLRDQLANKDPEIARLTANLDNKTYNAEAQDRTILAMNAELEQLRAKPARQVGDDWPKLDKPAKVGGGRFSVGVSARLVVEAAQRQYEYDVTPEKEAERIAKAAGFLGSLWGAHLAGGDERECLDCNGTGEVFGSLGCAECEGTGRLKVALAPSPVAVVMPERKQWDASAGTAENMKSAAWNAALDEIARLNRRAIPVELLERCLEQMESDWLQIDGEWGPTKGGLEGAVANGDAEEIRELRALLGKD